MVKSSQRGFTLIELVVVIVILGILAAFAVPRFARLDQQARISSVRALEGSLRSGATLARSAWLARGTNVANINIEGGNITMLAGYPTAATIANMLAQGTIQNVPGRYQVAVAGNVATFTLVGATNPANCAVTYTWAGAANTAPTIATTAANTMAGANGC